LNLPVLTLTLRIWLIKMTISGSQLRKLWAYHSWMKSRIRKKIILELLWKELTNLLTRTINGTRNKCRKFGRRKIVISKYWVNF
jgi:hypothetical protein